MDIKRPLPRLPREDILNPSLEDMMRLALMRMRHVVEPSLENPPPILFPLAESMRWEFFTIDDWSKYGDLETEHGRLTYTLSRYPERGAPSACGPTIQNLLNCQSILAGWISVFPVVRVQVKEVLENVTKSHRNRSFGGDWTTKSDCITVPVDYETNESASTMSLKLWRRSLEEIASQMARNRLTGGREFLQIHAFLKDPIYGLAKPFETQLLLFTRLLSEFQKAVGKNSLTPKDLERVAAQAAQESSYLTSPLVDNIALIHFHGHHQLPYANVPLDSLARAEFSVPMHVLEVAEEMLSAIAANDGQACPLVPILATARPTFSNPDRFLTPIIDGNHRATASHLLRFLANQRLVADHELMARSLVEYCRFHQLGKKWEIDLLDVLAELYQHRSVRYYARILADDRQVRKFATVESIPALVVQEEDFHTICKQRSEGSPAPVLLHPFHQTLFNDAELPFALPQKAGQTHGRPEAFRLLPLTPFGSARTGWDVSGDRVFAADLRKSMNGLAAEALTTAVGPGVGIH
jgi:hypothetical protein